MTSLDLLETHIHTNMGGVLNSGTQIQAPVYGVSNAISLWCPRKACELRDGGSRYSGKGVLQAVKNVNDVLGPLLIGMDPTKQQEIDDVSKGRIPCLRLLWAVCVGSSRHHKVCDDYSWRAPFYCSCHEVCLS